MIQGHGQGSLPHTRPSIMKQADRKSHASLPPSTGGREGVSISAGASRPSSGEVSRSDNDRGGLLPGLSCPCLSGRCCDIVSSSVSMSAVTAVSYCGSTQTGHPPRDTGTGFPFLLRPSPSRHDSRQSTIVAPPNTRRPSVDLTPCREPLALNWRIGLGPPILVHIHVRATSLPRWH